MNEEKKTIDYINIFKDDEKYIKIKLNALDYLINIREFLSKKKNLSNFYFFNKKNSIKIEKNEETDKILSEILKNNDELYIITDSNSIENIEITVFLNQKQICKLNISKNEKVKNFINIISNKIPKDSTLILDGFETEIEDAENDDIKDILDDNNNVYFISFKQEENIQNEEERKILLFKIKDELFFQKINKMKKIQK